MQFEMRKSHHAIPNYNTPPPLPNDILHPHTPSETNLKRNPSIHPQCSFSIKTKKNKKKNFGFRSGPVPVGERRRLLLEDALGKVDSPPLLKKLLKKGRCIPRSPLSSPPFILSTIGIVIALLGHRHSKFRFFSFLSFCGRQTKERTGKCGGPGLY